MGTDMTIGIDTSMDVCMDMYREMLCTHVFKYKRVSTGTCMDRCTDMCADMYGHVHGH